MTQTTTTTQALITNTLDKARKDPAVAKKYWHDGSRVARFAGAVYRKDYTSFPWRTVLLGIVAMLYLVNPLDLIPDALLVVGWLDDATLMGFFLASLRKDLNLFEAWEKGALPSGDNATVIDVAPEKAITS